MSLRTGCVHREQIDAGRAIPTQEPQRERHPGQTESEQLEQTIAQLFAGSWHALALVQLNSNRATSTHKGPQLADQ